MHIVDILKYLQDTQEVTLKGNYFRKVKVFVYRNNIISTMTLLGRLSDGDSK